MFSDDVAKQIRSLRQKIGRTREALSLDCLYLKEHSLTVGAIGSIETGRPDQNGIRRRRIAIDELLVLAMALNVPPLTLLFPPGESETEVFPGYRILVSDAAKWFTGEADFPTYPEDEEFEESEARLEKNHQVTVTFDGHEVVLASVSPDGSVSGPLADFVDYMSVRTSGR